MLSTFSKHTSKSDALADLEATARVRFEDRVLESTALNLTSPELARKELAQLGRSYDIPLEVMEQVAEVLMKDRLGVDLEEREFTRMVESIRDIEAIVDAGLREFKLAKLAKRLKIPQSSMMNAYHKALINQAPFVAYDMDQLDDLCVQVKEWIVNGWIPKGIVLLLHALGGTGKSLLIYELIECIVKGQPWNGYPVAQGRVLILQSDEPVIVTRERLKIRDLEKSHPVQLVPGWQVENMPRLEAYLKQYQDAGDPVRFCMIDSVTAINRNTLISENDTEYARFMLQLNDLGDRYGCTFAVVHHSNSEGQSRGTKALYNSASEVWGMGVTDEQSGERVIRVQKTRMGRPPGRYKFQFDEETFTFAYVGQEGEETEETAHTEKRIELWLNEDANLGVGFEAEEIAHHLQLNRNTVRKVLKEMWAKGLALRYPKGHNRTMLYHCGTRLIEGEGRSTRDQPAIKGSNGDQMDVSSSIDRLIDQNADFSLLKNANLGDQPINSPIQEATNGIDKRVVAFDRQVDRPVDRGLIDPPAIDNNLTEVNVGDLVIASAKATWFRYKSDKLPYREIKDKSFVEINALSEPLFFELIEPSKVLEVNGDRVRVRNQRTAKTSVFYLKDVSRLEKAHHD
ncbi:AAA family ATPase [Myxacorys almedinensis]|uniref:AAA family ATPase n=1 Tax=Myxacorys almedinensis A TaxID=2690445 RepID=A0A8J7YYC8_9CYAN|nr:AAA family ATPase [Myxacorys almedinensis]NDJ16799.1 AAA family ATPase [Myxacorys almedinensis A]